MRNIDKIKNMTLDEMAEFIDEAGDFTCEYCSRNKPNKCHPTKGCIDGIKQWLQQESEE